ncbi:MAG: peptide-N4-asparagine amidase [Stackebrandtia sp.]
MKRVLSVLAAAALTVSTFSPTAAAHDVPDEFGADWDDPRTAVKPIETPDTASCEVTVVDHAFADAEPYEADYAPPTGCGDDWSAVVLRLEGAVSGLQHDRTGLLSLGGVPIFKTSTPQPSPEGVEWEAERDVTEYADLLREPQSLRMSLDNTVDDVNDGVLDVRVYLTFYSADSEHPAPDSADGVLGLTGGDEAGAELNGALQVPRNSERLLVDVYASSSGGGCEEFWYLTAPEDNGYPCRSDAGPYREVQVLVDGQVAGIAAPYPHVYTGGWSNPFLWYVLSAPRTFDVQPITYDLTPYLGLLNDGAEHEVTVRVEGASESSEWSLPTAFRVWQDEDSSVVEGGVLVSDTMDLTNDVTYSPGDEVDTTTLEAGRRHTATGWLETSDGYSMITVDRSLSNESTHRWDATDPDRAESLRATWRDIETRTVLAGGDTAEMERAAHIYGLEGEVSRDGDRISSAVEVSDVGYAESVTESGRIVQHTLRDEYSGEASWTSDVPRSQRAAVGESVHRYRWTAKGSDSGERSCYDREIAAKNGFVVEDELRCEESPG